MEIAAIFAIVAIGVLLFLDWRSFSYTRGRQYNFVVGAVVVAYGVSQVQKNPEAASSLLLYGGITAFFYLLVILRPRQVKELVGSPDEANREKGLNFLFVNEILITGFLVIKSLSHGDRATTLIYAVIGSQRMFKILRAYSKRPKP